MLQLILTIIAILALIKLPFIAGMPVFVVLMGMIALLPSRPTHTDWAEYERECAAGKYGPEQQRKALAGELRDFVKRQQMRQLADGDL